MEEKRRERFFNVDTVSYDQLTSLCSTVQRTLLLVRSGPFDSASNVVILRYEDRSGITVFPILCILDNVHLNDDKNSRGQI